MTVPTVIRLSALAGLLLAISGCDKLTDAVQQGAEAAVENSSQDAGMSEDEKLGTKLNGYIECINRASSYVVESGEDYLSSFKTEAGPTGKERSISAPSRLNSYESCIERIKESTMAEPHNKSLEAAGTAYQTALGELIVLSADLHKYYTEKNYKDDDYAKGKEMHPKFVAAHKMFVQADQQLRAEVTTLNEGLLQRELERIEKEEGRKLLFLAKNVMAKAKKAMVVADVSDWQSVDLEELESALKSFESAIEECEAYSKAHPDETKSISMFSTSLISPANNFKVALKELWRRKRDNKDYDSSEKRSMKMGGIFIENIEGHPAKVGKLYNKLVSDSNRLRWSSYRPDPS